MTEKLLDIATSLTAVLEEETRMLATPGRSADLAEIVGAKVRLVAALEAETAQLNREQPDWLAELPADARLTLTEAIGRMRDRASVNAGALQRQIALSEEMMAAVAREAQRLTAANNTIYGTSGTLHQMEQATPIAYSASC